MKPMISVTMPVYNAEKYLKESIQSILNQTFQDFELIIVNDCSTDETSEILKKYENHEKVKIINLNKNVGCHKARNVAVRAAKGKYIAPHDADDVATPDRFQISIEVMEKTHADMIYGGWNFINEDSQVMGNYQKPLDFDSYIKTMNPISQGTTLIKKSIVGDGYSEEWRYAMDYDLWQRFDFEKRKIIAVDKLLTNYRVHAKATSQDKKQEQEDVKNKIIEKWNKIEKEQKDGLISVIMPTYNRKNIEKAIFSILNQTYQNFEIIVVNDGGKKPTMPEGQRIKYIEIEHKGLSGALNEGLRQAKGKYIAFLDDDDFWNEDHLGVLYWKLKNNKMLGLVYGQTKAVDKDGKELRDYNVPKFDRQQQKKMNLFCVNSVLVKKECFNTCGWFDEGLKTHCDFDMWRRVCRYFNCEYVPIVTSYYVQHNEMMSKDKEQMTDDLEEVRGREW